MPCACWGCDRCAARKSGRCSPSPTFRVDIEREVDLIEEVARVYGYNNIEEKTRTSVDFVQPFPRVSPGEGVRALVIGGGIP